MSSSSTSSIQRAFKYDVFISFRGEDTRNNFVGHLYNGLKYKGIQTYKDDVEIEKGKTISDQLIKSIRESRFYIIVFSKTYVSSSWCLDELVEIMECQKTAEHITYPIFYDVEPTEVRKQSGAVGNAIVKHIKDVSAGKWRDALKEASNLAGWELKATANGDESKLIQIVADDIFKKLCSTNLSVTGNLVGMEMRIKHVCSSLEIGNDDVRMIGIKGIGGGGKTTLARAVYDQISNHFEGKSFVDNVREVSKASLSGLKKLQQQILRDVFCDKKISISSVLDGKKTMIEMMCRKKVLVVLDDVDRCDQLEALVGDLDYFKSGSRIIITTRDEQVLVSHGVSLICNVNLLTDEEAFCLFNRYAFGKKIPTQGYNEMSGQVVRYAAGLPLTIKVLGSFLRGKNDDEWKDALERLKTIPQQDTQKMLEISYDALEPDLKDIFLDVARVLKGEQKDKAIRVLESCGFHASIGLSVLEKKSLITISEYGCLGMHDRIEEMGKYIDCHLYPDEHNRHSRLWIDKEIEHLLTNNLINEAIRCIKLSPQRLDLETFMTGLRNMKKVRVLYMCSRSYWDDSRVSQLFPNSLRYLCWRAYPFSSLHETFQADNLVGLDLSFSSILEVWKMGKGKVLTKLRFLDLSYTGLRELNLGFAPNLEILNLEHCTDLIKLHIRGGCPKLKYLGLDYSNIWTLNLGPTPDLEKLSLVGCCCLETLHMSFGCPKLKSLSLNNSRLRTLDIGLIPNLERLDLKDCFYLVDINAPDGCLEKLIYLDLSGCGRYKYFLFDKRSQSLDVGSLSELHLIAESIDRCPMHPVNNLPKFHFTCFYKEDPAASSFGNLEKLISIGQCVCANCESFSKSICSLNFLRKLTLEGSILEVAKDLHHLECLEELTVLNTKITHLPGSICLLKQLKSIKLIDCQHLGELPWNFDNLKCLEELTVSNTEIRRLPASVCRLKQLKSIKLIDCQHLKELPNHFGNLDCLEELILSNTNIAHLPESVCELKQLKSLKLQDCQYLVELPEYFNRLHSLEELILANIYIIRLPYGICELKQLKSLKLKDCHYLEELPKDFDQLHSLEELILDNIKLRRLPYGVCKLKQLKSLKVQDCQPLEFLLRYFARIQVGANFGQYRA